MEMTETKETLLEKIKNGLLQDQDLNKHITSCCITTPLADDTLFVCFRDDNQTTYIKHKVESCIADLLNNLKIIFQKNDYLGFECDKFNITTSFVAEAGGGYPFVFISVTMQGMKIDNNRDKKMMEIINGAGQRIAQGDVCTVVQRDALEEWDNLMVTDPELKNAFRKKLSEELAIALCSF